MRHQTSVPHVALGVTAVVKKADMPENHGDEVARLELQLTQPLAGNLGFEWLMRVKPLQRDAPDSLV